MVRPALRRDLVSWAIASYRISEREACRATGSQRSSIRYRSVRPHQEELRRRIREIAAVRTRAGYPAIHTLLRREGWPVNRKRVYRLYREEGLSLRIKRPRRHRTAVARAKPVDPLGVNQVWAMDFMHDTLASRASIRVLTAIDVATRECVALVAAKRFTGDDVARIMGDAASERGKRPEQIRVDNGTEFTSKALDHWAYWNRVELDFSRPGKPGDNAFIEAFNGTLRRECLSQHWFLSIAEAQRILDEWKDDYNKHRPHRSLAGQTPAQFRAAGLET
jgi:putative transposase